MELHKQVKQTLAAFASDGVIEGYLSKEIVVFLLNL